MHQISTIVYCFEFGTFDISCNLNKENDLMLCQKNNKNMSLVCQFALQNAIKEWNIIKIRLSLLLLFILASSKQLNILLLPVKQYKNVRLFQQSNRITIFEVVNWIQFNYLLANDFMIPRVGIVFELGVVRLYGWLLAIMRVRTTNYVGHFYAIYICGGYTCITCKPPIYSTSPIRAVLSNIAH